MANSWGKCGNSTHFIFLDSKIEADDDCSHEIKRPLILGRTAMTNLDSVLKSRDSTLMRKVHIVKAMVFPVVMYGCESWTITKAECWRIWYFWTVVLEKTLESPLAVRRSNQSILKKYILNIHWKDWCWSCCFSTLAIWCEVLTHWKRTWCWENWGQEKGLVGSLTTIGIIDSMEMRLRKFRETVVNREAWRAAVHMDII